MFQHIQWPADDQAQRLFHGRGHAWPGFEHLNIDWYAPLVLVTLYTEVDESWLSELEQQLLAGLKRCRPGHAGQLSVVVQHRCRTGAPFTLLCGQLPEQLVIKEDDLSYWLNLNRSQNTGLFLDMANGRRWVRTHSDGRRVLNLFAYTCGFSLAALAGGASKVVNVDMSRAALSHGRENHRLNDHDLSRVMFEGVNIFKSFGRLKKHGPYDLLICDPPTFQKGSVDIRRDYAKLLRRLPELMVAGGDCLLCLNAPDLGEDFLRAEVAQHAPHCVLVERLVNPPVFIEAQAGRGLKVLHFRYQP